jgi:hypothetical protein
VARHQTRQQVHEAKFERKIKTVKGKVRDIITKPHRILYFFMVKSILIYPIILLKGKYKRWNKILTALLPSTVEW